MIADVLKGSKLFPLFWICVFLGSCTMIQTTDNRTTVFSFQLATDASDQGCGEFTRTVYIAHKRPHFPAIDFTKLTPDEQLDLLMVHAEKIKAYLDKEEQYLREDISRYNLKCGANGRPVFQK